MDIKDNIDRIKLHTFTFSRLIGISVVVGLILRIILLFSNQTEISFTFSNWLEIFLLGAANDICAGIVSCFFMWLILIFLSESKYNKPWGYVILALLGAGLCYVLFFNNIFHEYGGVIPDIALYFFTYKFISFAIRLFVPTVREKWRAAQFYLTFFVYIMCILMNAISEYFFWNEFGVRYNFIAVDYLIYTNEVIGNIFESFPIIPLFVALVAITLFINYLLVRKQEFSFAKMVSFKSKLIISVVYFILVVISIALLGWNTHFQKHENVFVNELQANGAQRFYAAFMSNELNYNQFYTTLPDNKAFEIIHEEYNSTDNNLQIIKDSTSDVLKNVVLITVESLSASFLEHYGNTSKITPYLDKLMDESLVFNNLYATGNRTVRGLEAVTLSLPPCPGQSLIKKPNNDSLFSTGRILKEKGYTVQFFYGGDSYFDNMETFFSGNGYDIVDKKDFSPEEITFQNIWGVCDEDMFNKAISVFNKNAATSKPFFGHIMTVSNHRPFTYPKGKIDIPEDSKSRDGGVKYTDYALGQFIEAARKQPWFSNTIFVITADHCASSAGKTEIPLDKYHIPALIYAPGYIQPKQVDTLVSQIDIMPTVFGLLHFSYVSHFYGKDVFSSNYRSRALIATYQDLGYWENNLLTVLSPVKRVEQYVVTPKVNHEFDQKLNDKPDPLYINYAISNYQTVEEVIKKKK